MAIGPGATSSSFNLPYRVCRPGFTNTDQQEKPPNNGNVSAQKGGYRSIFLIEYNSSSGVCICTLTLMLTRLATRIHNSVIRNRLFLDFLAKDDGSRPSNWALSSPVLDRSIYLFEYILRQLGLGTCWPTSRIHQLGVIAMMRRAL